MSVRINSRYVKVMVDSGASRSCISVKFLERLKLKPDPLDSSISEEVYTANNATMRIVGQIDLSLYMNGLIVPFTFIVLPSLCHDCIVGTDFMTQTHAKIDFSEHIISFYDELVILPLIPLKSQTTILRLSQQVIIPPRTEALVSVTIPHHYRPQLSIVEPLPSMQRRNIGVARIIVQPSQPLSVCRLLNPTDVTITIPTKTPIATIEPLDINLSQNQHLLTQRRSAHPTFVNTITAHKDNVTPDLTHEQKISALTALGLVLDKNELTDPQFEALVSLLYDNKDLFATSFKDLPGTDLVMHKIDTTTEIPFRQRQFRHPPHLENYIEEECQKLYQAGLIEPTESPYNSAVFLVRKKGQNSDGSVPMRMVLDYRRLNSITIPKFFPLPTLENCLDLVGQEQAQYFSVLDQKSGYYSIHIHPDSRAKTAFSSKTGRWAWKAMPFGLVNAPATFTQLVSSVLHKELNEYALIYLDDLLVLSQSFDVHLSRLKNIFSKIRYAKLRLNGQKSFFCKSEVTYLGHRFSKNGIAVDENKTEVVRTYPEPRNLKGLRAFLGLTNYYRRFIKSYSAVTQPLRLLLQANTPFVWGEAQAKCFQLLKDKLCQAPILAYPRINDKFRLTTDACKTGLGYVLSQLDAEGRDCAIAYGGRATRSYEKNYTVCELEMAAFLAALEHFNMYLNHQPFEVFTDHLSLQYIRNLKLGNSRLIRWSLMLSQYQFTIHHVPGTKIGHADGLSRRPYPEDTDETTPMGLNPHTHLVTMTTDDIGKNTTSVEPTPLHVISKTKVHTKQQNRKRNVKKQLSTQQRHKSPTTLSLPPPADETESVAGDGAISTPDEETSDVEADDVVYSPTGELVEDPVVSLPSPINIDNQKHDPFFAAIIQYLQDGFLPSDKQQARRIIIQAEFYTIEDNVLWRLGINRHKRLKQLDALIPQVAVPPEHRLSLLHNYHESLQHCGQQKLFLSLKRKYHWVSMWADVAEWVKTCTVCQTIKTVPMQKKPPLHNWQPARIFQRISVDHFGPINYPGQTTTGAKAKDCPKFILVIIDSLSLNVELIPAKTTSAEETARLIFDHWCSRYGLCDYLISDRNQSFCGALIVAFYRRCGIRHLRVSPRHPNSNGLVEQANRLIIRTLRAHCTETKDWVEKLPLIAMAHRASVCTSLGVSPFRVLYGQEMRLPADSACVANVPNHESARNFLASFEPQLELLREIVKENSKEARERSTSYPNRTAKDPNFKVGDIVYLLNEYVRKDRPPHKLDKQFCGPYTIVDDSNRFTYKLQGLYDGRFVKSYVHASKLKLARLNRHLLRQKYLPLTLPAEDTPSPEAQAGPSVQDDETTDDDSPAHGPHYAINIPPYPCAQPRTSDQPATQHQATASKTATKITSTDALTNDDGVELPVAARSDDTVAPTHAHAVGVSTGQKRSVSKRPVSVKRKLHTSPRRTDTTKIAKARQPTDKDTTTAANIPQTSLPCQLTTQDSNQDWEPPFADVEPEIDASPTSTEPIASSSLYNPVRSPTSPAAAAQDLADMNLDATGAQTPQHTLTPALIQIFGPDATKRLDLPWPGIVRPKECKLAPVIPEQLDSDRTSIEKRTELAFETMTTPPTSVTVATTPELTEAYVQPSTLATSTPATQSAKNSDSCSSTLLNATTAEFVPTGLPLAFSDVNTSEPSQPAYSTQATDQQQLQQLAQPVQPNIGAINTAAAQAQQQQQQPPEPQTDATLLYTSDTPSYTIQQNVGLSQQQLSTECDTSQTIPVSSQADFSQQPDSQQTRPTELTTFKQYRATTNDGSIKLLKRKMINRKLHFLTKFSQDMKAEWVNVENLPSAAVAQFMARAFETKKRKQRQRSQFGQY